MIGTCQTKPVIKHKNARSGFTHSLLLAHIIYTSTRKLTMGNICSNNAQQQNNVHSDFDFDHHRRRNHSEHSNPRIGKEHGEFGHKTQEQFRTLPKLHSQKSHIDPRSNHSENTHTCTNTINNNGKHMNSPISQEQEWSKPRNNRKLESDITFARHARRCYKNMCTRKHIR